MDHMQHFPPGILTCPDPSEFDYSTFLQQVEDIPFPDPSHNTSAGTISESPLGQAPAARSDGWSTSGAADMSVMRRAQKQRPERRGHTKSRRGCYNCKRRRIKCQETRPACGHCVKTGLKCEYPSLPQITYQPHHQIPLFSLQDMRFFQHFLTQCYPHHPLRQEEVWTHEIPCIAHDHKFLMHAILGFAASELVPTNSSFVQAAMSHRIKAVKLIKKRLSESARAQTSYEEANALVAACFALTFQSLSLEDGLAEYITFIRGIVIVGVQMVFKGIKPIFEQLLDEDWQDEVMEPYLRDLPLIQRGWAAAAIQAISNLRPLCVEPVEVEYCEQLLGIAEKLNVNSFDAYKANSRQYAWWTMLPHSTFQQLINLDRQSMILLHAHWIALSQIMAFITEREHDVREKRPSASTNSGSAPGSVGWLKFLNARVDYEHQMYNQWPLWVEAQLDKDLTFFGLRL
ncbi:Zn(2)-Cys(6) zinc finger domain protein [Metarhizium robertsii]|uniref:Zn(2)-C6 fungal-type DNA-binding domain protein n=2 Tax=Metarhizium robertsii TaxID=568076 RepID=E9FA20_METRA|nr:Zn(2)-C6 fungal-type DNA-binding domain protein [Metarhizium robertsii ARSEF 23]EFY95418.1 Zn(2)-C6 fungal-type DNA-binding domain protein [Metarhizium robertsii ARSEF 23]EXU95900.1 Zn(2)-Cys(6) zinc finger domain protein [Metarhizium robertsii]